MENQVTTIEQSKRLMALGVPTKKAGMLWMKRGETWDIFISEYLKDDLDRNGMGNYPAYTVADLLEMMPWEIEVKNSVLPKLPWLRLNDSESTPFRFKVRKAGVMWICKYTSYGVGDINEFFDESRSGVNLIDPTCDLIEWLVSNGYKLEV